MSRENRHCAARAFCWVFLVPRGCQAQTCWKRVCCQCKRTFFTIPPPPPKTMLSPLSGMAKQRSHVPPTTARRGWLAMAAPGCGAADGEQGFFSCPWVDYLLSMTM